MNILTDTLLFEKAINIKCSYLLAISDCYSISILILQECPVFFLPEDELTGDAMGKINKEYKANIYVVYMQSN
ncbi:hypothetical protein LCGC14_2262900 [marine sediment metagenome]|uniref:Uncharacterized protein n=1 Tax=marine sediment metagenome TaxID=412755 RepID=A0A0F9CZ58_9ZZZZ